MNLDNEQKPFRWGIMGCGRIAAKFFTALSHTGEGLVVAAASKSMRRANRLQRKTGIETIYSSYEAMLDSDELDAVYIANTHNAHADSALLCLERGIPVLIEKPITQNAKQTERIIAAARANNTFAMEAMWTRFNPAVIKLQDVLAAGTIGEVRSLEAEFCVRMNPLNPKMRPWNRMCSPRLAGGALLDLGIYPIVFARMVFGQAPASISSSADMAWTGVDKSSQYTFEYSNGARAQMQTSFVKERPRIMVITGTTGSIHMTGFHGSDRFIIRRDGRPEEVVQCDPSGFEHEIREVHRCLKAGLTESPSMPLAETLETMQTLDTIRAQWGMKYPGE
ncbi:MAG: Gfo/Idh/MocA family oxidoreductase [Pontiella sp.]|nr:Gfo/Idh/MocA family oxidoreductase [Pontiella sp.]